MNSDQSSDLQDKIKGATQQLKKCLWIAEYHHKLHQLIISEDEIRNGARTDARVNERSRNNGYGVYGQYSDLSILDPQKTWPTIDDYMEHWAKTTGRMIQWLDDAFLKREKFKWAVEIRNQLNRRHDQLQKVIQSLQKNPLFTEPYAFTFEEMSINSEMWEDINECNNIHRYWIECKEDVVLKEKFKKLSPAMKEKYQSIEEEIKKSLHPWDILNFPPQNYKRGGVSFMLDEDRELFKNFLESYKSHKMPGNFFEKKGWEQLGLINTHIQSQLKLPQVQAVMAFNRQNKDPLGTKLIGDLDFKEALTKVDGMPWTEKQKDNVQKHIQSKIMTTPGCLEHKTIIQLENDPQVKHLMECVAACFIVDGYKMFAKDFKKEHLSLIQGLVAWTRKSKADEIIPSGEKDEALEWWKKLKQSPLKLMPWTVEGSEVKEEFNQMLHAIHQWEECWQWEDADRRPWVNPMWPELLKRKVEYFLNQEFMNEEWDLGLRKEDGVFNDSPMHITLKEMEEIKKQWKDNQLNFLIDDMLLTPLIKKQFDRVMLNDSQMVLIDRLRALKQAFIEEIDKGVQPFGIEIEHGVESYSVLKVDAQAWAAFTSMMGNEWFEPAPNGVSEEERSRELVTNKMREWHQWVVQSLEDESRMKWIKKYQEKNEVNLKEQEEKTQKEEQKNIEKELWMTLLFKHFNEDDNSIDLSSLKDQGRMQAVSLMKKQWNEQQLSSGGWKKLNNAEFSQLVLKQMLPAGVFKSMKEAIRVATQEHYHERRQSFSEVEWSGLGGDKSLLVRDPKEWGSLNENKYQKQREIRLKSALSNKEMKDEKQKKAAFQQWMVEVLNAASEFQWNDTFTTSLLKWGGSQDQSMQWIQEVDVNPTYLWGSPEDFRSLKEGLNKEKKAKPLKIKRWLNGLYQANNEFKEESIVKIMGILNDEFSDLMDIQKINPFDFFDQLDEKKPYKHAHQLHQEMVQQINKKNLELLSVEKIKTVWGDVLQNQEDHSMIREALKQYQLQHSGKSTSYSTLLKKTYMKSLNEKHQEIQKPQLQQEEGDKRDATKEKEECPEFLLKKQERKERLKKMNEVNVTVLDSQRALALEGQRMNHCVGNEYFFEQSKNQKAIIFHLNNASNGAVATLMLSVDESQEPKKWTVNQNRGKYNATVQDPGLLLVTEDILLIINAFEELQELKKLNGVHKKGMKNKK